jgi:glutathione synthase/RimK-type ligase-like ATP-grasp enzyme
VRFAFLVPDPGYPEPWEYAFEAEADALRKRGAIIHAIPWTNPDDLSEYDLVLPLIAWGYHLQYGPWLRLLKRFDVEELPVINPPNLLWWNSDKTYLTQLAGKGISTVETIEVESLGDADLRAAAERFGTSELVVKPPVSASAAGTHRVCSGDEIPAAELGKRMMIQPFVPSIVTEGEYAVILFDGVYSHTVVKRPKAGDFRVQPHLGGITEPCEPPEEAVGLAKAALAAAPTRASYARVDIVRGNHGQLEVMELELIEPALFLDVAPHGEEAFANAIFAAAERAKDQYPGRRAS